MQLNSSENNKKYEFLEMVISVKSDSSGREGVTNHSNAVIEKPQSLVPRNGLPTTGDNQAAGRSAYRS